MTRRRPQKTIHSCKSTGRYKQATRSERAQRRPEEYAETLSGRFRTIEKTAQRWPEESGKAMSGGFRTIEKSRVTGCRICRNLVRTMSDDRGKQRKNGKKRFVLRRKQRQGRTYGSKRTQTDERKGSKNNSGHKDGKGQKRSDFVENDKRDKEKGALRPRENKDFRPKCAPYGPLYRLCGNRAHRTKVIYCCTAFQRAAS